MFLLQELILETLDRQAELIDKTLMEYEALVSLVNAESAPSALQAQQAKIDAIQQELDTMQEAVAAAHDRNRRQAHRKLATSALVFITGLALAGWFLYSAN